MFSKFIKLWFLSITLLAVLWGCISDNQAHPTVLPSVTFVPTAILPQTPLPFSYLAEIPSDEFLSVHIRDFHIACVEEHCNCPTYVGEDLPPVPPLVEEDGKLILNRYSFDPPLTDWLALREETKLIALYSNYGPHHSDLQYYSSFPIKTPIGGFTIVGVNSKGDVQVKINDGFTIIPAGSVYTAEQPEKMYSECTYLHEYALYNYGLIKDENVVIDF
jgi:hypothetical protein